MHFTINYLIHLINLVAISIAAYLAVVFVANDGKHLFAACLVFAAMVPFIGSAAVQLKRDWQQVRRRARLETMTRISG